jgi:hypothetical protein
MLVCSSARKLNVCEKRTCQTGRTKNSPQMLTGRNGIISWRQSVPKFVGCWRSSAGDINICENDPIGLGEVESDVNIWPVVVVQSPGYNLRQY